MTELSVAVTVEEDGDRGLEKHRWPKPAWQATRWRFFVVSGEIIVIADIRSDLHMFI